MISSFSECEDCGGSGKSAKPGTPCFRCDGTGLICDRCGESEAACSCEDDEEPVESEGSCMGNATACGAGRLNLRGRGESPYKH